MHCLFISSLLPEPEPRTGFEIANRAILQAFEAAGARVTPVGFRRPGSAAAPAGAIDLGPIAIENAGAGRGRKIGWVAKAFGSGLPVSAAKLRVMSDRALRERLEAAGPFDALILNSIQMPAAYPFLLDLAPFVFVAHNVEHVSATENAAGAASPILRMLYRREAGVLRRIEARICARADAVHTLAEADLAPLGLDGDPKASPLALTLDRTARPDDGVRRHDIGLIGTWSWAPNRIGLDWFVEEIVPRLPPDLTVAIAGAFDGPHPRLPAHVRLLGRVPDAQSFVSASRVIALATRAGTGVQLKTLEVLEEGMPAVATTLALRGIDGVLPDHLRVADDPAAFAAALTQAVEATRAGVLPRGDGRAFARARREEARDAASRSLARLRLVHDDPSVALVTATYRGDFERCRLLCDSIDARASGHSCHYLLVEDRDHAMFAPLEGPRRRVVRESEILPPWLRAIRDPLDGRRRLWVHPFGLPLRGWHAQQLRRIAFAAGMREEVMIACDSDVVFLRPFEADSLAEAGAVRFYCVPNGVDSVSEGLEAEHAAWSRAAGRLLGIEEPRTTRTGYITTLVPWRRDTVREMLARIERVGRRPAMRSLAATRALSECTIYGRFVEEAEGRPERHRATARPLALVRWTGEVPDRAEIERLMGELGDDQVACCIQSFIGADPALIRSAARLA